MRWALGFEGCICFLGSLSHWYTSNVARRVHHVSEHPNYWDVRQHELKWTPPQNWPNLWNQFSTSFCWRWSLPMLWLGGGQCFIRFRFLIFHWTWTVSRSLNKIPSKVEAFEVVSSSRWDGLGARCPHPAWRNTECVSGGDSASEWSWWCL